MPLRYSRGFGEAPASVPASFFPNGAALIDEAQDALNRGVRSYYPGFWTALGLSTLVPGGTLILAGMTGIGRALMPVGLDTLQNLIVMKRASLEQVRAGTLAPENWLASMTELIGNIQRFFAYQDASNSLTANARAMIADMGNSLRKIAGAGLGAGALLALGFGAVVAWKLLR